MTAATATTLAFVQGRGLSKTFGHVRALQDVDVDIFQGEILAIVGDNGAGKSTLTKILSGVHQPDRGEITINGRQERISDPHRAHELGISTVFQNLALIDCRDVASNLFLGREPTRWFLLVDRRKMRQDAEKIMSELHVHLPSLEAEVGQLSGGQRQSIAIGRALSRSSTIILMDEPTAALGIKESRQVLDLILHLRSEGNGIVIISHNLRHVFSVADRIMVLRRGRLAGVRQKSETTPDDIVKLIVGAEVL